MCSRVAAGLAVGHGHDLRDLLPQEEPHEVEYVDSQPDEDGGVADHLRVSHHWRRPVRGRCSGSPDCRAPIGRGLGGCGRWPRRGWPAGPRGGPGGIATRSRGRGSRRGHGKRRSWRRRRMWWWPWVFREDVLAGGGGPDGLAGVEMVGRGDEHRIDTGVGEQGVEVAAGGVGAVFCGEGVGRAWSRL